MGRPGRPGVRVSPARPAAVRLCPPLSAQRAARLHVCVPVSLACALSQRVHPSQPQRLRSASELLCIALPLQRSSCLPPSSPAAAPAAPLRRPPRSPSGRCWPVACGRPPARASRWRGVPSRNALAHALPGRAAQGGRADPQGRAHQREQGGMGWANAVGGKGRLIFLSPRAVVSLSRIAPGSASCCRRAARFVVSPTAV